MARSLCDLLADTVERAPERAAVVTDGAAVSYGDLGRRAGQVARLIAAAAADNPRVALLTDGGLAHVVLYWGVLLCGGVTVELNPGLGDSELQAQLDNAAPGLLIAEGRQGARLAGLGIPSSLRVAVLDHGGPSGDDLGRRLLSAVDGRTDAAPFDRTPGPAPDNLASIVYTSGTTGRTKGVCLSHANLAWTARAIADSFGPGLGGQDERFSGLLPLFYTFGKSVLHVATLIGAPIVFTGRAPSPGNVIAYLTSERITHLSAVPYLCNVLLTSPAFTADAVPDLHRITIAGGAVSEPAMADLLARFPGMIVPMYGLTEASTRVACMPAGEAAQRPHSCGKPLAGVDVKIADGEILVRGPNVMRGYFRDDEATAAALGEAWLRTGDLGVLDDDGYLTVSGRLKDVIKVMGESVSPFTIESAIAALPEVAEVAVKGVPDPLAGEAIAAFVVLEPGVAISEADICAHCARVLGRARVPTHVHVLAALPKTSSGKVRKHLLAPEPPQDG